MNKSKIVAYASLSSGHSRSKAIITIAGIDTDYLDSSTKEGIKHNCQEIADQLRMVFQYAELITVEIL